MIFFATPPLFVITPRAMLLFAAFTATCNAAAVDFDACFSLPRSYSHARHADAYAAAAATLMLFDATISMLSLRSGTTSATRYAITLPLMPPYVDAADTLITYFATSRYYARRFRMPPISSMITMIATPPSFMPLFAAAAASYFITMPPYAIFRRLDYYFRLISLSRRCQLPRYADAAALAV